MTTPLATDAPAALEGVRVLDLTGTAGQYAGKLLADLGADVVRVEPPAGSPARTIPPFADDDPTPNKSLAFWYWNTSKRSITLDLATADGKALFRRLLPRFDVLVHTFTRAQAAGVGLAPEELAALHPGLIECSITPYGEWGPHADWLGTDMTVSAMSGLMTLAGYPDRAPTMPPGEQAAVCGGVQAAQGIMVALLARDRDGKGQRVEVSQQEAMSIIQETAMQTWDMRRELRKRTGNQKLLPGYGTYECADGHVFCMIGVAGFGAPMPVLFDWMRAEGVEGTESSGELIEVIARTNLRELTALLTDPVKLQEFQQKAGALDSMITEFFMTKTKSELYIGGQGRRLLIGPVNSAKDLREDLQLRARAWWQEVEHPEAGRTITYPGPPYHHSETPWRIRRRPPLLGEHTLEILEGELELTREQTTILMGAGVI